MNSRDYKLTNAVKQRLFVLQRAGYKVAAIFLHGSQNYMMETKDSDIDVKAWIIPSYDDILHGRKPVSKVLYVDDELNLVDIKEHTPNNYEHIEVKDIRLVPALLWNSNPAYIELINSSYYFVCPELQFVIDNRQAISEMNEEKLFKAIMGTMAGKKKDLRHPYPTRKHLIDEHGYDPKQLHHHTRLVCLVDALFLRRMPYEQAQIPFQHQHDMLLNQKLGRVANLEVDSIIEENEQSIKAIAEMMEGNWKPQNKELKEKLQEIMYDILDNRIKKELGLYAPLKGWAKFRFKIIQLWIDTTNRIYLGKEK